MRYEIDSEESLKDYLSCLDDSSLVVSKIDKDIVYAKLNNQDCEFHVDTKYQDFIPAPIDDVIHGKNKDTHIVNISIKNDIAYIYKEKDGIISCETQPFKYFVLAPHQPNETFSKLKGNNYYSWIKYYAEKQFQSIKNRLYQGDYYFVSAATEAIMMHDGYTYFKGMTLKDVSVLSFDLETTTKEPGVKKAKILCIGTTLRKQGAITKRLFREDHYSSQAEMLEALCQYIRETDPTLLIGYNIMLFDLPYLAAEADRYDVDLSLGRDGSSMQKEKRVRQFRKDGSQSYDYQRFTIFGREIVDIFFSAIKFDISRKYESYALKSIVKHEGLEKEGRTHYDASRIAIDWQDPVKREDICNYCMDDSEDPIKLMDFMLPSVFLSASVIPKPLQVINETSAGSQLNAFMMRAYLQNGFGVPKADKTRSYQGAVSFAIPGIYKNVQKIDFSAMYPSIISQFKVFDPIKDPHGYLLKAVDHFMNFRNKYKLLFKETGDKIYDDLQNMNKVLANSIYGFLSANGLNFNNTELAEFVTAKGRELLGKSIMWATSKTTEDWLELFRLKTGKKKDDDTDEDEE